MSATHPERISDADPDGTAAHPTEANAEREAPRIHRVGSRAILVDLPDLATVMAWHAALSHEPLPGQVEAIAAAKTLLVVTDSHAAARDAAARLASFDPPHERADSPREITIDVVYDGDDLESAARAVGKTADELIAWHTSTPFIAAFGGFAPGFTYCAAQDPKAALDVPRRSSPRTNVPAGAVGLAGTFTAVYPRTSPGGWQLIGTTVQPMWDADAAEPAAVRPGDVVRYRQVSEHPELPEAAERPRTQAPHRPVARLDETGMQTLYQDHGRAGLGDLGVTSSGTSDRAAARVANAAVGNPASTAVLENLGGLKLTALVDTVVAVTGARSNPQVGTTPVRLGSPVLLPAGHSLTVGQAALGARGFVALRGGLIAPEELGSSSSDLLAGLGPQPLQPGALLSVPTHPRGTVSPALHNPERVVDAGGGRTGAVLRCVPGPRDDWFDAGIQALTGTRWSVTANSNRVGLRLTVDHLHPVPGRLTTADFRPTGAGSGGHRAGRGPTPPAAQGPAAAPGDAASRSNPAPQSGPPIVRSRDGELASEGMVAGSIQVPPSGEPVVFLRDHPVTGGYPVLATVVYEDLDIAAQLPPGGVVEFIAVDPDTLEPLAAPDAHDSGPAGVNKHPAEPTDANKRTTERTATPTNHRDKGARP